MGNKFLDDLRHAHVLIHVLDVSGTTNEKGESCEGYDPIVDIEWLNQEIHDWIFNNLWGRWETIVRRHRQCSRFWIIMFIIFHSYFKKVQSMKHFLYS